MSPVTRRGLLLAALILLGWLASLVLLLPLNPGELPPALLVLAVLARTFLQTGLFIVGHDAMHGVLLPGSRRWNDHLGSLVLLLYGALPYGRCRDNHQQHHHRPGTATDPDFHAPGRSFVLAWYGRFMGGYLRPLPLTLLVSVWGGLALASSVAAVALFCVLPLLLSSLQLFLVGTYLPHRGLGEGLDACAGQGEDRHRSISLALPEGLSLLACYHFGYHREHHRAPQLAWHQLPEEYRRSRIPAALALPTVHAVASQP
ncbi:fatty acid desaturase [Cyanobium sp. FGCU-6]|nr:fatty acid desaturase [Cyanobium sp. FGCU6]